MLRMEATPLLQRVVERVLNDVVGIDQPARLPGDATLRPAAETRKVAVVEGVSRFGVTAARAVEKRESR